MSRNWPKTIKRITRRYTNWYWYAGIIFKHIESHKLPNLTVLEDNELIDYLVEHRKSFIRWGDGESAILYGSDLMFQDYDQDLKKEMIQILREHVDNEDFLLGISHHFICLSLSKYKKQKDNRPSVWRTTRYVMHRFCRINITYGDAFLFRPLSNVNNSDLQNLWKDKDVILVSSDKEHEKKIKNLNSTASLHQILIPANNCYHIIDRIEKEIFDLIQHLDCSKENVRIVISGGPGGKALAYRLILKKFIVYDVGNYFSWKVDDRTNEKGI